MYTYSVEHELYLKKQRHEKIIVIICRLLIVIILTFLWEFLSINGIINSFMFSCPSKILKTIINLFIEGSLFIHIKTTIYEVIFSFIISIIIGLIVATILWSNKRIFMIIEPFLIILNSMPKVALGPLIIIWIGASTNSIIFMALLINSFVTILEIYDAFSSVNKNYIIMAKSFHASNYQILKKIVFPSSLKSLISILKINMSMSLIGVVMGELLVSKKGIGYLIMYGSQVFNINLVLSGVIILCIVSYIMYIIIDKISKKMSLNR